MCFFISHSILTMGMLRQYLLSCLQKRKKCTFKRILELHTGIEHKINFVCCNCESIALTLARAELRPATTTNPRQGFISWGGAGGKLPPQTLNLPPQSIFMKNI